MDKNYNTREITRKGFEETTNINVEKEVSELIKKGADKASMNDLRRKYGDDKIFDTVQEAYFEKLASIRKRSIKFTKLIERKYGMYGHPLHIILNKAIKYKKKYNLSEEEFELFRQYYQRSMNSRNNTGKLDVLLPNTNMAKVFGDDPYTNRKIHVNEGDHRIVKEIMALYDLNRMIWQQCTLQSITYNYNDNTNHHFIPEPGHQQLFAVAVPLNPPAYINDSKIANYSSFIHPVIAAMFLPKIARFDEYFLFTNLAYILRCKYLGEPISTYHSYLMLYNLVTDPNDVVCNADSPIKDILNRVLLQTTLWKNVMRLRHTGIYDTHTSFAAGDLMIQIDNCKLSSYDAPDLMMIGDENVIIRRLLSSLAYRCATIYSIPTVYPMIGNGVQINTLNMPINYTQVTKVPMVYIRLSPTNLPISQNISTNTRDKVIDHIFNKLPYIVEGNRLARPLDKRPIIMQNRDEVKEIIDKPDIQSSLNTIQPIMTNGRFEYRSSSVVGTDGVLIVSIPRRTYQPLMTNVHNLPQVFNMSKLPHNAIGLETLNNTHINTNLVLSIGNSITESEEIAYNNNYTNKLFLKSAVVLNEKETDDNNNNKFIYGSKTYVFNYDNAGGNIRVYDPIKESNNRNILPIRKVNYNPTMTQYVNDLPLRDDLQPNPYIRDKIKDFRTNQTILIYTNELKNIPNNALSKVNARTCNVSIAAYYTYYELPPSAMVAAGAVSRELSYDIGNAQEFSSLDYVKANYAHCFNDYLNHNTIIGYFLYNKEIPIGADVPISRVLPAAAARNILPLSIHASINDIFPLFIPISY
jgi:hypothetical protein